jgi:signal transduction histidine kinase
MKVLIKNSAVIKSTSLGVLVGFIFPIIFMFLDLKQLSLEFSFNNMYTIFKSQNIYIFSTILFPLMFAIIGGLFSNTLTQNIKLANQESYITSILNSLVDCIVVCDSSGKIHYANHVYYKTFSYVETSINPILAFDEISKISKGKLLEITVKNKKGEFRRMSYLVFKLDDKIQNINHSENYIVSIRDIEDLKKNEDIIESQTAQLFEASKLSSLGEMASGFAHEINNPLAIISGRLALTVREVKKEVLDKEIILKNLETCKDTIGRITKIISGLRNLSHAEKAESEEITIRDLIEDSIVIANLKISGKGINFITDVAAVENEKIICNSIQISQVLMNLLGNAIDAIEKQESPWLILTIEHSELATKITIKDSGNGIPLEVQKKMFEPMYTTKPVGKGTGLGLSISKAIIEKHNGTLTINNNCPNTCFEIVLPKTISSSNIAA